MYDFPLVSIGSNDAPCSNVTTPADERQDLILGNDMQLDTLGRSHELTLGMREATSESTKGRDKLDGIPRSRPWWSDERSTIRSSNLHGPASNVVL